MPGNLSSPDTQQPSSGIAAKSHCYTLLLKFNPNITHSTADTPEQPGCRASLLCFKLRGNAGERHRDAISSTAPTIKLHGTKHGAEAHRRQPSLSTAQFWLSFSLPCRVSMSQNNVVVLPGGHFSFQFLPRRKKQQFSSRSNILPQFLL